MWNAERNGTSKGIGAEKDLLLTCTLGYTTVFSSISKCMSSSSQSSKSSVSNYMYARTNFLDLD